MLEQEKIIVNVSIFGKELNDFNFIAFCQTDEYIRAEDRKNEFYKYLIYWFDLNENTDIRDFKFDFSELKGIVPPQYLNFNEENNIFTFFDLNK